MPDQQDKYRLTQVPSPLVQPGGSGGSLLHPLGKTGTVVIGEDSNTGTVSHKIAPTPGKKGPTPAGSAPKAAKVVTHQGSPVTKEDTIEQPAESKSKGNKGCIVAVVAVIIAFVFVIPACTTCVIGLLDNAEDDFEEYVDSILEDLDDYDDYDEADSIYQWSEDEGYGDCNLAFFEEDIYAYYYAPETDTVIREDHKVYTRGEDGKFYTAKGKKLPKAEEVVDEDYVKVIFMMDSATAALA